jgi:enterochelin esterase-like enzyme
LLCRDRDSDRLLSAIGRRFENTEAARSKLRLLYVSRGDRDGLLRVTQGVHRMLDEKNIPHVYNIIPDGRHDFAVWRQDLYQFAQLLFRERQAEEMPEGR